MNRFAQLFAIVQRFLPWGALLFGLFYLASALRPPASKSEFDLAAFGRLPVLVNGRIKPLDTVARTSLLVMQNRQRVSDPTNPVPLTESPDSWLADLLFNPAKADTYPTFKVDSPEVLELLGIAPEDTKIAYDNATMRTLAIFDFVPKIRSRFSYTQLRPKLPELDRQARLAEPVDAQLRTTFQKQVLAVNEHVVLYLRLKASVQVPESKDFLTELVTFERALPAGINAILAKQKGEAHSEDAVAVMKEMADRFTYLEQLGYLRTVPPDPDDKDLTHWRTTGEALLDSFGTGRVNPTVMAYAVLGHAWRTGDSKQFNQVVKLLHDEFGKRFGAALQKSDVESRFNAGEPFYKAMVLYAFAFFLAVVSWLKWPDALGRSAFYLTIVAFVLTTAGIATRMWLEGRPPVTNLYSSALFVGWGAVLLCLFLEKIYRNAIGLVAAGSIGFVTLLIAHHLSLSGDTLEMMRAVLDTNLWLATHVVVVTSGYAATFLAGFLAIIYIVRGVFTKSLDRPTADSLTRMVYGIVCFATLFSLVGTVLGGIWADQSWGRFWGWDPKENGALIIVLWNAVILHARWGGMVKQRGLMMLAVFGNVVTAWSWFGTNMLGVGLHSYGFMDAAFYWLIAFVAIQVALIAVASVPEDRWRSFRRTTA
ncbi:MAG TPA: cytochrome c biogenesis protein CcsA [Lacunisphaera sp.]|jgi:ABC-type transport system involved in cytochrome c biogenesis permease subunit|nr:cytochrome c biogenesis protein CcsA [Lacunisphaera sp.]